MVLNAKLADNMSDRQEPDVYLVTLPLYYSCGQTVHINSGFYTQATVSLLPRFDLAAVLHIMERDNVTIFPGVLTMYWAMLNDPKANQFDLDKIVSNLFLCASGGSAMPIEVMRALEDKFNVVILQGCGLSKTSPVATFNRGDDRKPGSVGGPVWGVELCIVDADDYDVPVGELGEIAIKSHTVMKGYYQRDEATAEVMPGGRFHTGILASLARMAASASSIASRR